MRAKNTVIMDQKRTTIRISQIAESGTTSHVVTGKMVVRTKVVSGETYRI